MQDDSFSPFRGYDGGYPGANTRLRDAYYQGFISSQELAAGGLGKHFIDDDGNLVSTLLDGGMVPLTRRRVEQLKIDMLLGTTTEQHTFYKPWEEDDE